MPRTTSPTPSAALPEPVTAIPVTAVVSPGTAGFAYPAPVITPTSIVPTNANRPAYPERGTSHYAPVWPVGTVQPQLPPGPGGGYQTGTATDDRRPGSRPPVGVLLLGVLIGLLVFGSTGYLVGSTSGGSAADAASAAGSQEVANRRTVGPVLAPLADGWVPWLGACLSSSDRGGVSLGPGEQSRVACAVDATVDVFFVLFASTADRDKARAAKQAENATSATLAPGAAPVVTRRTGTSKRTTGAYIEFAYQNHGQTYGGIWWDDSSTTGAAYIEKVWTEGDGGWRPLRDLWQRYT